ncbi:MAG: hypothetical protein LBH00_07265 [Planctomycetaceae bacterium]|jgi:hypothetical protein|nr:hypothetical protein [Planctomycetaceae bacterium]
MTKNITDKVKKGGAAVLLAGTSLFAGLYIAQMRQEAFGQAGYPVPPQVVVNPQAVPLKWVVDIAPLDNPVNPAQKLRVITVVDTETKKIAVYHEEMATGKIFWLSTRDIQPDLTIGQFNAVPPLPSEISREIQRMQNQSK